MDALRYDKVLSRLKRVRWHPHSRMWSACCPAHDDRNPSLWVWLGRSGNLLARCASRGCSWEAIVEATGTEKHDWFPEKEKAVEAHKGKVVARFPYQSSDGKLLYECLRIEPGRDGRKKDFRYRRPQEGGTGWIYNLEDVAKVLYRLPEILDPKRKSHPVFVVEGEGKVETLRKLGLLATTSPCGAGHWIKAYGCALTGRRVAILPDNDEPGLNHALQVAANLIAWEAQEIRIVHLPGLPNGGDVIDWLGDVEFSADRKKLLIEQVRAAKRYVQEA